MTLKTAVARADILYPNAFPFSEKVKWLSELDGKVYKDCLGVYEGAAAEAFEGYSLPDDLDESLLVPYPYDDIYIKYLAMHFDELSSDIMRYNNSAVLFNTAYMNYINAYNRTHEAKQVKIKV